MLEEIEYLYTGLRPHLKMSQVIWVDQQIDSDAFLSPN